MSKKGEQQQGCFCRSDRNFC